jgi:hypothetical protein
VGKKGWTPVPQAMEGRRAFPLPDTKRDIINKSSVFRIKSVNYCGEPKIILALCFYWKINPRTIRGFKAVAGNRTTLIG